MCMKKKSIFMYLAIKMYLNFLYYFSNYKAIFAVLSKSIFYLTYNLFICIFLTINSIFAAEPFILHLILKNKKIKVYAVLYRYDKSSLTIIQ